MRRLRWIVPLIMVLVLAALIAMPFTATGTRLAVAVANKLPGLTVQHRGGTLFGDLELGAVRFVTDAVSIEVSEVRAKLDRSCLWESRLCFTRLSARSLRVALLESDDKPSNTKVEDTFFSLPFGIRAPKLELGSVDVAWPGGGWQSSDVSAGVAFRGEDVSIRRLVPQLRSVLNCRACSCRWP